MNLHNTTISNNFNEDYYEHGIEKGISGYENYHYIPTRSISEAITICNTIEFKSVVDFGCAKGYLVHALNLLGKNAIGLDISNYAIEHCHPNVKDKLILWENNTEFPNVYSDLLIAKDVLEHIPEDDIPSILKNFYNSCDILFVVVPLGDDNKFRIREYEMDKTHVTKKDEEWWIDKICDAGFTLTKFEYVFGYVKEKWTSNALPEYKFGNGFFIAKK